MNVWSWFQNNAFGKSSKQILTNHLSPLVKKQSCFFYGQSMGTESSFVVHQSYKVGSIRRNLQWGAWIPFPSSYTVLHVWISQLPTTHTHNPPKTCWWLTERLVRYGSEPFTSQYTCLAASFQIAIAVKWAYDFRPAKWQSQNTPAQKKKGRKLKQSLFLELIGIEFHWTPAHPGLSLPMRILGSQSSWTNNKEKPRHSPLISLFFFNK